MPKFDLELDNGTILTVESDQVPTQEEADQVISDFYTNVDNHKPKEFKTGNLSNDELRDMVIKDLDTDFNAGQFASGVGQGVMQLIRMGAGATEEIGSALLGGEFKKVGGTVLEAPARALFDIADLGEAIRGRAGDLFADDREEIIERRVERMRQDMLDQEKRKRGFLVSEENRLENATEIGSFVLDPTNIAGVGLAGKVGKVAGLGLKAQQALDLPNKLVRDAVERGARMTATATGKGLEMASSVLSPPTKLAGSALGSTGRLLGRPRELVNDILSKTLGLDPKVANTLTYGAGGMYNPLTQAEIISKLGSGAAGLAPTFLDDTARIFNILGDSDRQFRFIEQAILDPSISPQTRKLLEVAGNGTQKGLDLAFNSAVNGLSAGSLQAIMATMNTNDPEAIGSAFGAGLMLGGATPVGQPSSRIGKLQGVEADRAFLKVKHKMAQAKAMETLGKTDPTAPSVLTQLAINGTEANVTLLHGKEYKEHFKAETGVAPTKKQAMWEDSDGNIFLDVNNKDSVPQLVTSLATRTTRDILDNDLVLRDAVIKELDPDGSLDADEVVNRFVSDRFTKMFTSKLDAKSIERATSGNLDTLVLMNQAVGTMLGKLGLVDNTGSSKSGFPKINQKILSNPYIKNLDNNYKIMNGAIARKTHERNLAEVSKMEVNLKKAQADLEKSNKEAEKIRQKNIKSGLAETVKNEAIKKDEAKVKVSEDYKQLLRNLVSGKIDMEQSSIPSGEHRVSLLKQGKVLLVPGSKKTYVTKEGYDKMKLHNDLKVASNLNTKPNELKERVTQNGESIIVGDRVGDAVLKSMPKGKKSEIQPQENLRIMDLASAENRPLFIDGLITGIGKSRFGEGKTVSERSYISDAFVPLQFLIPNNINPKNSATSIQAQGIDLLNASLIVNENPWMLGGRQGNIRDIVMQDIKVLKDANASIQNVFETAKSPAMDNNIAALLVRDMLTKELSKENIHKNQRLALKSFDPGHLIEVRINDLNP